MGQTRSHGSSGPPRSGVIPIVAEAIKADGIGTASGNGAASANGAPLLCRCKSFELRTVTMKTIKAKPVSRKFLENQLGEAAKRDREADQFTKTLLTCVDILANGTGGMIVSVIHEDMLQGQLNFDYLDGGLHTKCFRDVSKNIGEDNFGIMLELLTAHNQTDRWEKQELEALCKRIPEAQKYKELLGQPKDGAITISHQGSVKGAAMHLKYQSEKFQLRNHAGTRHASALGFAEHLCTKFKGDLLPGVVFARSDAGGAHAFIPRPEGEPLVLHFDTLKIPSQADMLKIFREKIIANGQLLMKKQPVLARTGQDGEQMISVVSGKVTSSRTIDSGFMVIRANTPDQEYYALEKDNFEKHYEVSGRDLAETENLETMAEFTRASTEQLITKGFRLYRPRLDACRWAYKVKEEDLKGMPTSCFQSAWDPTVLQPLRPGDILGMPAPEEKAFEIYWIHPHVLNSYAKCTMEEVRFARAASMDNYNVKYTKHGGA